MAKNCESYNIWSCWWWVMKLKVILSYLWDGDDMLAELVDLSDISDFMEWEVGVGKSLESADELDLTFCNIDDVNMAMGQIGKTMSRIVLVHNQVFESGKQLDKIFIPVENPRLSFMRLMNDMFIVNPIPSISDTAVIHDTAVIGDNCLIGHHVVIGENVLIGSGSTIWHGVAINDNVRIGNNCVIYPNTVIGWDGFGYEYDEEYEPVQFPHTGSVVIGNNVHIGSNVSIDRGTLDNTIIEDDVKIDNLCHIAHNVRIGRSSLVIAMSLVAGSVRVGHHTWIAPAVTIANGLKVGDRSMIGTGSVVIKNVESDSTVVGVPARLLSPHRGVIPIGYED